MRPKSLSLHPSCPKRLITALRRAKGQNGKGWNFTVLARQLSDETLTVNRGAIHKLVTKGIEPKGESVRVRCFLSKHPRKRVGDCNRCGKRVYVMNNGTLESHVHPDGTYCNGSDTRDFLRAKKIDKKTKTEVKPAHRIWWNKLHPDYKDGIIFRAYNTYLKAREES